VFKASTIRDPLHSCVHTKSHPQFPGLVLPSSQKLTLGLLVTITLPFLRALLLLLLLLLLLDLQVGFYPDAMLVTLISHNTQIHISHKVTHLAQTKHTHKATQTI
jgi:hypothetical protein